MEDRVTSEKRDAKGFDINPKSYGEIFTIQLFYLLCYVTLYLICSSSKYIIVITINYCPLFVIIDFYIILDFMYHFHIYVYIFLKLDIL